jgi:hypothetical protein
MSVNDEVRELKKLVTQLSSQVGILQDEQEIRKLHHCYGYYLDKCLYDEVVDLFADENCEVRFMRGVFKGKAGVKRLYVDRFRKNFTNNKNGPIYGFLLDHAQMQDVIHVAPNQQTAKGRFRCTMQAGRHLNAEGETRQWWEGGLYENEYVKEDDIWKIKVLNYRPVYHATFENGWAYTRPQFVPFFSEKDKYPKNRTGPDTIDKRPVLWPDTDVLPFHYPHPVTGKKWKAQK